MPGQDSLSSGPITDLAGQTAPVSHIKTGPRDSQILTKDPWNVSLWLWVRILSVVTSVGSPLGEYRTSM